MKVLFLDESGDHNLSVIDPQYPMFVLGGVAGALGFKHVGFVCVVPLAALLLALSLPPLLKDAPQLPALARSGST